MAKATPCSRVYEDITHRIGNTPLVKLRRVTEGCGATVLGKVEKHQSPLERQRPHR